MHVRENVLTPLAEALTLTGDVIGTKAIQREQTRQRRDPVRPTDVEIDSLLVLQDFAIPDALSVQVPTKGFRGRCHNHSRVGLLTQSIFKF